MRYHYVLLKTAKVKKTAEHTKCCEICGGTETFIHSQEKVK